MRYLKIVSFSFVAFIVLLFVILTISSGPPKESKIVSEFAAHRAGYEEVRRMLSEDKEVTVVATWGIETTGSAIAEIPPAGGMPVERYRVYLALLKDIGAILVSQSRDRHEVQFGVWGSGFGGDTRHVAVSWLQLKPSNTVTSLDAFYRTAKPRSPSYVHIDGNWYIWADW